MKCDLCEREVPRTTIHHLIPKQKDGASGPIAHLCSACHRQLHHLFSNAYLATTLYSISRIKKHPEMRRFLRWIRKQDPAKHIRVHRKRH